MRTSARMAAVAAAALALAGASAALAADFTVSPGGKNLVQFESKAPLETVTGKTQQVHGRLTFDPASVGDSVDVEVDVDLASLDTGIELRNKHMREDHLETDKYPQAVFRGGRLTGDSKMRFEPGKKTKFKIAGDFELHGVHRRIEAPVEATLQPDGSLHVETHFDVKLSDYGIPRPQFLVMRLDEVQHITFDVTALPASK